MQRNEGVALKYNNHHVQKIIEAMHSNLRSLSDRAFEYEVIECHDRFEIVIHCGEQHESVQIRKDGLVEYFEAIRNSISGQIIVNWIRSFRQPVDVDHIFIRPGTPIQTNPLDAYKL